MAAPGSGYSAEMLQSQTSQISASSAAPTFPISAYLPAQRSAGHTGRHPDGKRRSAQHNLSNRQDSQSSQWSKGSEKGRDSVDLGRPLSEPPMSYPARLVINQSRPGSLARDLSISPLSASTPTSPRSGQMRGIDRTLDANYDSEKISTPLSPSSHRTRLDSVTSILEDGYCRCRRNETEHALLEDKALNILIYLSFPNIIVSFLLLIWTIVAIFTAIILSPFRLCSTGALGISQSLTSFLIPPLRIQHALIYSSRLSRTHNCRTASRHGSSRQGGSRHSSANSSPNPSQSSIEYKLGTLILVHLFSPIISLGVAFGAWTAAVFWFYAAILGDPSGNDKPMGYNDGKSSVLGVRAWWAHWLARPVKGT